MADKIFLRGGSWYRASAKQLPDDIDMDDIIANPSAQYPIIEDDDGGGSGMVLESYQNAAMSAAVEAYVFRDADDNIFRVYEPLRNNDVSRQTFAYADSIDKFPFDNVNCFSNVINDVKLIDLGTNLMIQGCNLEAMVIDQNSNTKLWMFNTNWKGNYGGGFPNSAELYITGDDVIFTGCNFGVETFFDSVGDTFLCSYVTCASFGQFYCQSKVGCTLYADTFGSQVFIKFTEDAATLSDTTIGDSGYIIVGAGVHDTINIGALAGIGTFATNKGFNAVASTSVGTGSQLRPDVTNVYTLDSVDVGVGMTLTITENKTDWNVKNIDGTAYKLGVDTGAVTAVAV